MVKKAIQWFISGGESGYISKEGKKALGQRKVPEKVLSCFYISMLVSEL